MTVTAWIITWIWTIAMAMSFDKMCRKDYPFWYRVNYCLTSLAGLVALVTLSNLYWAAAVWSIISSLILLATQPRFRYIDKANRTMTWTDLIVGYGFVVLIQYGFWAGMIWAQG